MREAQIARLARDGLSNPEIGARLRCPRAPVQSPLSHVLGITSCSQLRRILPPPPSRAAALTRPAPARLPNRG